MARTKEGGELKAANLPNWLVLEEENAAERNLGSEASAVAQISYLFLLASLLILDAYSVPL